MYRYIEGLNQVIVVSSALIGISAAISLMLLERKDNTLRKILNILENTRHHNAQEIMFYGLIGQGQHTLWDNMSPEILVGQTRFSMIIAMGLFIIAIVSASMILLVVGAWQNISQSIPFGVANLLLTYTKWALFSFVGGIVSFVIGIMFLGFKHSKETGWVYVGVMSLTLTIVLRVILSLLTLIP